MAVKLLQPPVVRRLEYINDYLTGVKQGLDEDELQVQLAETKKRLEREKSLAVGRGNPYRKGITRTSSLTNYCRRVTESMRLIENDTLTVLGERYLIASEMERRQIICKAYSDAYPHFGVLASTLQRYGTLVLPMRNTPPFRPMAEKYGLDVHQVTFDTVRDLATDVGLVNWSTVGKATDRRQHVYLVCGLASSDSQYTVYHEGRPLHLTPNTVTLDEFRECLWENYIDLVNGVTGFPVFYSEIRDHVCYELKISDPLFNQYTESLIEDDDKYNVIWSQGILPRKQDSASMLKSLPPKNIDGNYIIYLKIVRHR
ncbi:MAG: hypothetical protein V1710_10460 [Candidatus Bathyarchaeota archaeon]